MVVSDGQARAILVGPRQELLARYEELDQSYPESLLEAARQDWVARYGPEQLKTSPDLLALFHGTGPKEGMLYELEFGQRVPGVERAVRLFGSASGGFSLKFKVYRSQSGTWMKQGPEKTAVPCTEHEATEITGRLGADILRALGLADELQLVSGNRDRWLDFNRETSTLVQLGWAHKYLATIRPDLFSFHHNAAHLGSHLIRLGVVPEDGRWLVDWQWRQLRLQDEELARLASPRLSQAAYNAFGQSTSYWVLRGDRPSANLISVSWGAAGDLQEQLQGLSEAEARKRLRQLVDPIEPNPATAQEITTVLFSFALKMQPGDRVMLLDGQHATALGTVESDYEYRAGTHQRSMKWAQLESDALSSLPNVPNRFYHLQAVRNAELRVAVEDLLAKIRRHESATVEPFVPLTSLEERIRSVLERKGQIILYGPPGTGKTFHARRTANELLSRELFEGRSFPSLNESERERVAGHVTFCTFHPAYAYEDFIEGYRPHAAPDGTAGFELQDGVFFNVCKAAERDPAIHQILIIDEINRGNVPAILGELITLLEQDKRGTLSALLPVSKRSFRVPPNVWIFGTMNTADRSISLLDTALRRRFGFLELMPEPDRVTSQIDDLPLHRFLAELNARIRQHLRRNARELQIGHAYFLRSGRSLSTKDELHAVMRDDVIPLLGEYCFENVDTLRSILGEELVDLETGSLRADVLDDAERMHAALIASFSLLEPTAGDLEDAE